MAKTVYVENNQNILDICLQETGRLSSLVAIHEANSFENIPTEVKPGDEILIPDGLVINELAVVILQKKKPATNTDILPEEITQGGIGYMGIEIDFVVS